MFVHEDQDVAADSEELSTFPVAGISDTNERSVFRFANVGNGDFC